MANYEPISMKVAATLAAKRIVKISAAHTVDYASLTSDLAFGITTNGVTETNQAIPVAIAGIAKVELANSINAGSLVAPAALGLAALHVDTTAGSYVVGKALETGVTGSVIQVLIQPHFKSIP